MVEKKVKIPLKPKKFKTVKVPEDIIVSPPKRKTKQIDIKSHIRSEDIKVRKHKRTIIRK